MRVCVCVCMCYSSCCCSILCVIFLLQNLNWIHNPTTIVLYGNVDVVTVILAAVTPSTFVANCSCFFLSDEGSSMMLDLLGAAALLVLLGMLPLLLGMLLVLLETLLLLVLLVVVVVAVIVSGDMLLVLSISMGCSSSMSTYSMALSSSSCSSITEKVDGSKY